MSEEKLESIDRRLSELVNITGNLVTTVRELVGKVEDNTERITSLENQQKTTSAQLTDVVRVVIKTDERVESMEKRIDEGFEEIHNESRIVNRKIDWTTTTSDDHFVRCTKTG